MKTVTITLYEIRCRRCRKTWRSTTRKPVRCGKCKTPYYAIPRKKKGKTP